MATVATQAPAMDDTQQATDRPADLPRPYKCPMCPKAFHRLEHQTRHIRTHTGEKPHACQFPGCSKRFSRSDELTRHSRIHNNPNSRRSSKAQHGYTQAPPGAMPAYAAPPDGQVMMPPPPVTRSAPQSQLSSPNVSPPHNYAYVQNGYMGGAAAGAATAVANGGNQPTVLQPGNPTNINLLATAASQVERDAAMQTYAPPRHAPQSHSHLQYYRNGHSSTSLSAYALSNSHSTNSTAANSPLHSRSHSPSRHFETPLSTAPSSPTFSHNSISPTPDHTPLATPAHSPRLRPYGLTSHLSTTHGSSSSLSGLNDHHHHGSGVHLPSLRQLSLSQSLGSSAPSSAPGTSGGQQPTSYTGTAPLLAPMEPAVNTTGAYLSPVGSGANTPFGSLGSGGHLADIMSRTRGEERKLPVPRVASGDMQSFTANSGDAMEL